MSQPLFGLVPAGLPVITQPTETPTPTSLIYTIPTAPKPFSHVVVFLLPGIVLPPTTAAAIYLITPPNPAAGQPDPIPKFLGGVGPGKESAIFKLSADTPTSSQIILGISIEDGASVGARIDELNAAKTSSSSSPPSSSSQALVLTSKQQQQQQPTTLVLAQRIIKNAFNFLSSFSGQAGAVEVVPMRAFEDWWRKFESRVRTDPGFLERDD